MERIQAAIQKAKEQRALPEGAAAVTAGLAPRPATGRQTQLQAQVGTGTAWAQLSPFEPDARLMERNRVVTFADADPAHVTFDMLRTRILRTMRQSGWMSLGITSPTNGCGKTTTALNLAFSLAHQSDVRTVLVDLDLRHPSIAKEIGLTQPQSMASVLQGTRTLPENFVRYGDNLAIGTNAAPIRSPSEILLNASTAQGVARLKAEFLPDLIIYDLPPMLMSDDVIAFVPHLDCMLLVAGCEISRLDEIDKCEHDLGEQTNVLGVVLNQCRYSGENYGYY